MNVDILKLYYFEASAASHGLAGCGMYASAVVVHQWCDATLCAAVTARQRLLG